MHKRRMQTIEDIWPWPKTYPPDKEEDEHHYRRRRGIVPPPPPPPLEPQDAWSVRLSTDAGNNAIINYRNTFNGTYPTKNHGLNAQNVYVDWALYEGPIFNSGVTCGDIVEYLFQTPSGNPIMRGLVALYNTVVPFANERNPTTREVEYWIYRVLFYFRSFFHDVTSDFAMEYKHFVFAELRRQAGISGNTAPTINNWSCPEQSTVSTAPCEFNEGVHFVANSSPNLMNLMVVMSACLKEMLDNQYASSIQELVNMSACGISGNYKYVHPTGFSSIIFSTYSFSQPIVINI
jgi:hypothetical protein